MSAPVAAEYRIRQASSADLDEIWAIESAVFTSTAWSRAALAEELSADHRSYLVLETAPGADAGAVSGAGTDASPAPEIRGYGGVLVVGREGDVQTIALTPETRGSGQGRRLMLALLAEADRLGAREVFLEVRADNPVARALYTSLGFAEIGVRPRYYQPDGVDAIVMRHELKETR